LPNPHNKVFASLAQKIRTLIETGPVQQKKEEAAMRSVLGFLASGLMVAFCVVIVSAQASQTGGITGVVTDKNGALVAGATVSVINEKTGDTERTATTGDDGGFSVTLLSPGTYRLEISAANFKKANIAGVRVETTKSTRQDATLEPGNIQETVNIEAAPSMINPSSATTGQGLDSQTLKSLPLASPNFLFLLSLSTGVTGEPTDVRAAGRGARMLLLTANAPATTAFRSMVSTSTISTLHTSIRCRCRIPIPCRK